MIDDSREGGQTMQAQELLDRIASLRQRFQRTPSTADAVAEEVEKGAQDNQLLDAALRPLHLADDGPLPIRLSHRARRLLKEARELLSSLRAIADEPVLESTRNDALARLYHEAAAMLETAIRTIQAFPESALAQARLCDGLEGVLSTVAERLDIVKVSLDCRKAELSSIDVLAGLLTKLASGELTTVQDFLPIANGILDEVKTSRPLRFLTADATEPARFAAAHSLTVAQVMARLIDGDPEFRGRAMEPVLAALLHDVGMVTVPPEILTNAVSLDDAQRRVIEKHTIEGGEILKQLGAGGSWLAESAIGHHERLDGTGYPAGHKGDAIGDLVRMLAVADVYSALATARCYRPALEPRTALTDTLLLADRGVLDRLQAERLLNISFYPVGSVVELADGGIGVVVAVNRPEKDFVDPARPVVSLLRENDLPLACPRTVNLKEERSRSVLRTLDQTERFLVVGKQYPAIV